MKVPLLSSYEQSSDCLISGAMNEMIVHLRSCRLQNSLVIIIFLIEWKFQHWSKGEFSETHGSILLEIVLVATRFKKKIIANA